MKQRPNKSKTGRKPEGKKTSSQNPRVNPMTPLLPRRKWLFRFIAIVVMPLLLAVLLLALVEIALRIGGYGYDTGFFRSIHLGGQEYFINNERFSLRFFPPQLVRWPDSFIFPATKPPDTVRIFIFGESAAMGDPQPAYGAGRCMEALLSERFPGKKFEVVNTGMTAIDSHVILPIARECARHDGDFWIIYMGNNEMVGPFGAATVFGARALPRWAVQVNLLMQQTRTGQMLVSELRKLGGKSQNTSWGGMEMFLENQIAPDDPRKETVYRNFEANLRDIVAAGVDAGAKVILNTVSVNLKDCPPFASLTNSNLSAADQQQFDQIFAEAKSLQSQGDFPAAADLFTQATKLDPQFAEAHFRLGQCELELTNTAAAPEQFQIACDDDALPFRADTRINSAIRQVAQLCDGDRLVLCDAEQALAQISLSHIAGDEFFWEHVHFNFDGSYHLGKIWAEQIARQLSAAGVTAATTNWASQETCEHWLGLTDWNRFFVIQHMIDRLRQPPLSSQFDNETHVKTLEARVAQLHSRMNPVAAKKVAEDFQSTLEQSPDDYYLHENFALFLQSSGDLPGAIVEWRHVHDLIPQDSVADFELGRFLGAQGQWAEAESLLREAIAIRPSLTQGWIELGNVLASQEKFEPALASYSHARQQQPRDAQTVFRIGEVLTKLNRHTEAIENYRAAATLDPANWEIHFELAGELDLENQLSEACNEFAASARLDPDNSRTHFNYGVLLAKLGRFDEARYEFEETVRLEPTYQKARDYLAALQATKK